MRDGSVAVWSFHAAIFFAPRSLGVDANVSCKDLLGPSESKTAKLTLIGGMTSV